MRCDGRVKSQSGKAGGPGKGDATSVGLVKETTTRLAEAREVSAAISPRRASVRRQPSSQSAARGPVLPIDSASIAIGSPRRRRKNKSPFSTRNQLKWSQWRTSGIPIRRASARRAFMERNGNARLERCEDAMIRPFVRGAWSKHMCGIAGLLYFDRDRRVDPALLDRATDAIAHRGPDGRGVHLEGNVGLGHRRLAIIDTSDAASQPFSNEDGTIWIVFNGEIYNFQEFTDELKAKGHRFKSRSDTEVIVHLYEELGERVVERLRGMFAFAIWDGRRRTLLLARDRVGKKPLYYKLDREALRFGSEIKAILEDPAVVREPDPVALDRYLTYGYVPGPLTAFKGIAKLPPGHTLLVREDGRSELRRYWELRCGPKRRVETERDERAVEDDLLATLDEATRLRMISDVPLGAFLSGGVDSSAVVASMRKVSGAELVRTFSIGFEEKEYDESEYAATVARHLSTTHEALTLRPPEDTASLLGKIAWHYGEPFADPSCVPTFAVSKLARARVTVALSGDGGDELFLGYGRYKGTALEAELENRPLARALGTSRAGLWALTKLGRRELANHLGHARVNRLAGELRYLPKVEHLSTEKKRLVCTPGFLEQIAPAGDAREIVLQRIRSSEGETLVERVAHADFTTYLPDDILVKVDVASMAFGLETRAPLLDHKLAELVATLPARLKMRGLETKSILKRALAPRLPREILHRRKMGFGVPLEHWFRGALSSLLEETLLARRALERGVLEERGVRQLLDEHRRGTDWQYLLFNLLMLELWFRTWIDQKAPAPVASAPRT
jgi:asparagine synthase (glutamine-hydrolysing)